MITLSFYRAVKGTMSKNKKERSLRNFRYRSHPRQNWPLNSELDIATPYHLMLYDSMMRRLPFVHIEQAP
jgi:hypothetical protein